MEINIIHNKEKDSISISYGNVEAVRSRQNQQITYTFTDTDRITFYVDGRVFLETAVKEVKVNGIQLSPSNAKAALSNVFFSNGGGGETEAWKDPLWFDIEAYVEEHAGNGCVMGLVFSDSNGANGRSSVSTQAGINISTSKLGNSTCKYYTHYGVEITPNTDFLWDVSKDIPDSYGNNTRAVFVYATNSSVIAFILSGYEVLYTYGNYASFGNLGIHNVNTTTTGTWELMRGVKFGNQATATSISNYGFYRCMNMKYMVIPNGVTSIGTLGLSDTSVNKLEIPSSLRTISTSGFGGSRDLKEIILNEGFTTLGSTALQSNVGVIRMKLPSTLTSIGTNAFREAHSLQRVEIPSGFVLPSNIDLSTGILFLSKDGMVDFFNNLGITSTARTLTLGSTNLAKLTAAEKAIATNKGYTLA